MLEHHFREIRLVLAWRGRGVSSLGGRERVLERIILVDRDYPMGRQALDREGTGDTGARIVAMGLVIEVLELGLGGDRGVDLLLPRCPRLPPFGVKLFRLRRPLRLDLARNLPFFPGLHERRIQGSAQRLHRC